MRRAATMARRRTETGMDAAARFRALFETHHAAVRRYAHHRALRGADADDVVAENVREVSAEELADPAAPPGG